MELRTINYKGTDITISDTGDTVIWKGMYRNIYYNPDGYSTCAIKVPGKGWRGVSVARLVAMAFIPNPDNLPEVNHKDYDRTNSSVDNLEWITHADNVRYSNCNRPDMSGEKNPNYGNRKLSEIYKNNLEYAKEKQGRPGLQNGRCRKISLYYDGVFVEKFDYIVGCCEYVVKEYKPDSNINAVATGIGRSLKMNRPYLGHLTFVKH